MSNETLDKQFSAYLSDQDCSVIQLCVEELCKERQPRTGVEIFEEVKDSLQKPLSEAQFRTAFSASIRLNRLTKIASKIGKGGGYFMTNLPMTPKKAMSAPVKPLPIPRPMSVPKPQPVIIVPAADDNEATEALKVPLDAFSSRMSTEDFAPARVEAAPIPEGGIIDGMRKESERREAEAQRQYENRNPFRENKRLDIYISGQLYKIPLSKMRIELLLDKVLNIAEDPNGNVKFDGKTYQANDIALLERFIWNFFGGAKVNHYPGPGAMAVIEPVPPSENLPDVSNPAEHVAKLMSGASNEERQKFIDENPEYFASLSEESRNKFLDSQSA